MYMTRGWWVTASVGLFLAPFAASALGGGFPQGSVWFSRTDVTAGDSVTVYTVVYDAATTTLSGTLAFQLDGADVSTTTLSIAPGESKIMQYTWRATEGQHSFTAEIRGTGTEADASRTTTALLTVAAAPPSPIAQYVGTLSQLVASSSPVVGQAAGVATGIVESVRTAGLVAISNAIDAIGNGTIPTASGNSTTETQVLGAETYRAPTTSIEKSSALLDGVRNALTGARIVFANKSTFYPLFWILVVLILVWFFRRMRRERID